MLMFAMLTHHENPRIKAAHLESRDHLESLQW